jgi:hypothetical protein
VLRVQLLAFIDTFSVFKPFFITHLSSVESHRGKESPGSVSCLLAITLKPNSSVMSFLFLHDHTIKSTHIE